MIFFFLRKFNPRFDNILFYFIFFKKTYLSAESGDFLNLQISNNLSNSIFAKPQTKVKIEPQKIKIGPCYPLSFIYFYFPWLIFLKNYFFILFLFSEFLLLPSYCDPIFYLFLISLVDFYSKNFYYCQFSQLFFFFKNLILELVVKKKNERSPKVQLMRSQFWEL